MSQSPESTENKTGVGKKAVLGTFYLLTGDYLVYLVNFVRSIILARLIAPELFGVVTLADFFRNLFGQPRSIGFDQAVIQRQTKLTESFNGHFFLNLAALGMSLALVFIATPFLLKYYDHRVVWVLYALMGVLVLEGLSATPATFLRKNLEFRKLSVAQFVAAVMASGVSVYLARRGFGLLALVSTLGILALVNAIMIWFLSPWRPSMRMDRDVNREILRFGLTIWVAGFFSFIMLQFDDFLVGQFAGLATLGFYSKAYALAQQPMGLFSQVLNKVAGPVIAELKDQQDKIERGLNLVLGIVFKGTVFIGMMLFIWAPQLIDLLIGKNWLPMVPMFRGLILYLVAQPIWDILGSYFTFTGQPGLLVRGQTLQAALLVGLGTWVIYRWGGMGAALAVSGILVTTTFFYLFKHVRAKVQIDWWNGFGVPGLAVIGAGSLSFRLISGMQLAGVAFWLSVVVVPALFYLGLLGLLQGRKLKQEIEFIHQVMVRK